MKKLISFFKTRRYLITMGRIFLGLKEVNFNIFLAFNFLKDYFKFKQKMSKNYSVSFKYLYPKLDEKSSAVYLDPVYFYQDIWCAKKIFEQKPKHHYDVGSSLKFLSIISQFIPVTTIDIRYPNLKIDNLSFIISDARELPFEDSSVDSLSCLCVLEHIGLGRYGDEIDPLGTEKAVEELIRVLSKGGNLYISVPVDQENIVYFNAHRAFSRDYIFKLFSVLKLVEEKYIYGEELFQKYDPAKGFGTGLYHFVRR